MEKAQLVQILLPLSDNEGKPFPSSVFEALKDELTNEFDGVTAFLQSPAEGRWTGNRAGSKDEEIVIFEVMVRDLDIVDWNKRRSDLEARFRQDRVIIRHMAIGLV